MRDARENPENYRDYSSSAIAKGLQAMADDELRAYDDDGKPVYDQDGNHVYKDDARVGALMVDGLARFDLCGDEIPKTSNNVDKVRRSCRDELFDHLAKYDTLEPMQEQP